jgi:hypothetical protein
VEKKIAVSVFFEDGGKYLPFVFHPSGTIKPPKIAYIILFATVKPTELLNVKFVTSDIHIRNEEIMAFAADPHFDFL